MPKRGSHLPISAMCSWRASLPLLAEAATCWLIPTSGVCFSVAEGQSPAPVWVDRDQRQRECEVNTFDGSSRRCRRRAGDVVDSKLASRLEELAAPLAAGSLALYAAG